MPISSSSVSISGSHGIQANAVPNYVFMNRLDEDSEEEYYGKQCATLTGNDYQWMRQEAANEAIKSISLTVREVVRSMKGIGKGAGISEEQKVRQLNDVSWQIRKILMNIQPVVNRHLLRQPYFEKCLDEHQIFLKHVSENGGNLVSLQQYIGDRFSIEISERISLGLLNKMQEDGEDVKQLERRVDELKAYSENQLTHFFKEEVNKTRSAIFQEMKARIAKLKQEEAMSMVEKKNQSGSEQSSAEKYQKEDQPVGIGTGIIFFLATGGIGFAVWTITKLCNAYNLRQREERVVTINEDDQNIDRKKSKRRNSKKSSLEEKTKADRESIEDECNELRKYVENYFSNDEGSGTKSELERLIAKKRADLQLQLDNVRRYADERKSCVYAYENPNYQNQKEVQARKLSVDKAFKRVESTILTHVAMLNKYSNEETERLSKEFYSRTENTKDNQIYFEKVKNGIAAIHRCVGDPEGLEELKDKLYVEQQNHAFNAEFVRREKQKEHKPLAEHDDIERHDEGNDKRPEKVVDTQAVNLDNKKYLEKAKTMSAYLVDAADALTWNKDLDDGVRVRSFSFCAMQLFDALAEYGNDPNIQVDRTTIAHIRKARNILRHCPHLTIKLNQEDINGLNKFVKEIDPGVQSLKDGGAIDIDKKAIIGFTDILKTKIRMENNQSEVNQLAKEVRGKMIDGEVQIIKAICVAEHELSKAPHKRMAVLGAMNSIIVLSGVCGNNDPHKPRLNDELVDEIKDMNRKIGHNRGEDLPSNEEIQKFCEKIVPTIGYAVKNWFYKGKSGTSIDNEARTTRVLEMRLRVG